jgi:uncharacterized RDD family membrane protein YckC
MNTPEPVRASSIVPIEARAHHGQKAGIVSRTLAAGLDVAIVICLLVAGYSGWAVARFILDPKGFSRPQPSFALFVIAYLLVAITYLAISWSVTGRSFGQHIMGLRVTDRDGRSLHFVQAVVRATFCIVFPVGLLWVAFSASGAALHDLVLRTSVTYDWTIWHG